MKNKDDNILFQLGSFKIKKTKINMCTALFTLILIIVNIFVGIGKCHMTWKEVLKSSPPTDDKAVQITVINALDRTNIKRDSL